MHVLTLNVLGYCCDKSETSCYHLVTRLMTVTDLLQVDPVRLLWYRLFVTSCYELVVINLLTSCYVQTISACWNNLLRICWPRQPCYKMITTCPRLVNSWEQAVWTRLVDKLWDFYACQLYLYCTHIKTHKLFVCKHAVDKLCSHCLFLFVVTRLEQAVNNL
jgi:hypothetical protein